MNRKIDCLIGSPFGTAIEEEARNKPAPPGKNEFEPSDFSEDELSRIRWNRITDGFANGARRFTTDTYRARIALEDAWKSGDISTAIEGYTEAVKAQARLTRKAVDENLQKTDPDESAKVIISMGPAESDGTYKNVYDSDKGKTIHTVQLQTLAESIKEEGVDYGVFETISTAEQAYDIAELLEGRDIPVMLSFTPAPNGNLRDGTPLGEVIDIIESKHPDNSIVGYALNCCHYDAVKPAYESVASEYHDRLSGFYVNASKHDPGEHDNCSHQRHGIEELPIETIYDLVQLFEHYCNNTQERVLGLCCGGEPEDLEFFHQASQKSREDFIAWAEEALHKRSLSEVGHVEPKLVLIHRLPSLPRLLNRLRDLNPRNLLKK